MAKYKIYITIDEQDQFWIVYDNGMVIRNPKEEDLKNTTLKEYNPTNICSLCRKENNITDNSILYPGNVLKVWVDQKKIWNCKKHGYKYHNNNPNSNSNIIKSLRVRRNGQLKDARNLFADNCQTLTCELFEVENLNLKYDNYNFPIDHSKHPILGILQTKGAHYKDDTWRFCYNILCELDKKYDNMILWCVSQDGRIIERLYIIPKKETDKRSSIAIYNNPSRGQWYEKYRVTDKELLKKANDIWYKITNLTYKPQSVCKMVFFTTPKAPVNLEPKIPSSNEV